jgi:GNAT superfamily N-acetyltransferase
VTSRPLSNRFHIRPATAADIPQLLPLMKKLSVFEEYDDNFGVTSEHLLRQGFQSTPPDFHSLVAHGNDGSLLYGMLVYYFLPFTASGRPILYIKELFVDESVRNHGIGAALMKEAAKEAQRTGCSSMKWQVARWNDAAIRFYERLGATANRVWIDFSLGEKEMRELTRNSI